jgi:hypothetical protein
MLVCELLLASYVLKPDNPSVSGVFADVVLKGEHINGPKILSTFLKQIYNTDSKN